jgi:hypothetical protein
MKRKILVGMVGSGLVVAAILGSLIHGLDKQLQTAFRP